MSTRNWWRLTVAVGLVIGAIDYIATEHGISANWIYIATLAGWTIGWCAILGLVVWAIMAICRTRNPRLALALTVCIGVTLIIASHAAQQDAARVAPQQVVPAQQATSSPSNDWNAVANAFESSHPDLKLGNNTAIMQR